MMDNPSPIRLLLVDDHRLMRAGISALIDNYADLEVVGEAGSRDEAIRLAVSLQPDVILIDILYHNQGGITTIVDIMLRNPHSHILVLTNSQDDELVFGAIRAGALGYLLKDASADDLISSIRMVYQGQPALDASIAMKLIQEIRQQPTQPLEENKLTDRELEVLHFLMKGYSNQEIGRALVITERTVSAHVNRILKKMNVTNRTQAALLAFQAGYQNKDNQIT